MQWTPIVIIIGILASMAFYAFNNNLASNNISNIGSSTASTENFMEKLAITSPSFSNGEMIPVKYTCNGEKINPPISITGVSQNAKSLVFILEDPDAPVQGGFIHWVRFNIPPANVSAGEGADIGGLFGKNSAGNTDYVPPCPPSGIHHYYFKIYALDIELPLSDNATKTEIESAMAGHIISSAELIGLFGKKNK